MTFRSILYEHPDEHPEKDPDGSAPVGAEPPAYFPDLHLDQIVESVTGRWSEYHLEPFFHAPLRSVRAITYRHEVFRDLRQREVLGSITAFAGRMRTMRERLAQAGKLYDRYQRESWFADAVDAYADAVGTLAADLATARIESRGLVGFRDYLTGYVASEGFTRLRAETRDVRRELAAIRYSLQITDGRIRVSRYASEADYSAEVEATFEKFRQGSVRDYRTDFSDPVSMNHVESAVLELVAKLHPGIFGALDDYCDRHADHLDPVVAAFDREVHFYVAYLEHLRYLARTGAGELTFCLPVVSADSKAVSATDTFDLALAGTLVGENASPVCNDVELRDPERILVVSGPNQGGKTTFARTFGQLHHLASIGCPVPGRHANLFLFDRMFTHFEREEDATSLHGKLEDELIRIHDILAEVTGRSIVIMNEIFTSTALNDAVKLGQRVLDRIIGLDLLAVCVTFIDELSRLGPTVVSMVSTVSPDDPAVRTYKVVRRPADGLSHAMTIAAKYGLGYHTLRERIAP